MAKTSTPMTVKDLVKLLAKVDDKTPVMFNSAGVLCWASGIDETRDANGSPVVVITRDAGG